MNASKDDSSITAPAQNNESGIESRSDEYVENTGSHAQNALEGMETNNETQVNVAPPSATSDFLHKPLAATEFQDGMEMDPPNQNEDEIPMWAVSDSTSSITAYVMVESSKGKLFAGSDLEDKFSNFITATIPELTAGNSGIGTVLEDAVKLYVEFDHKLSFSENVAGAVHTLYRIREGKFLSKLREVSKAGHVNWTEFVKERIPQKSYRTIRQYIQISEISNVERYAILGKELLFKVAAALKQANLLIGDDPIGTFLKKHGIPFDPNMDQGPEQKDFMDQVMVAINHQVLLDKGISEISREKVAQMVENGKTITVAMAKSLRIAKDEGLDVEERFEKILDPATRVEPILRKEDKGTILKKAAEQFLSITNMAFGDPEYLAGLSHETIEKLIFQVDALEDRLNGRT